MKKIFIFFKSIIIGIIGGLLGAWGGAENTSKNWRRILIPIILTLIAFIVIKNWWILTLISLTSVLSMGYGIPSITDPKPSFLGKLWYNVWKGNEYLTTITTRLSIGILEGICLLSIPIIKGNWLPYYLSILGICMVNVLFGGDAVIKNEGMFTFLGKGLLIEEFIIYAVITTLTIMLII